MGEKKVAGGVKAECAAKGRKRCESKSWKKPTLEDVSGKIMAQPYIRFT